MRSGSEYLKIPVSDFLEGVILPVDIFLEIIPGKIQRAGLKGSSFSLQSLPANVKKNLQWLLLKKEDYRFYVGFTVSPGLQGPTSQTETQRKLQTLEAQIEQLLLEFIRNGLNSNELDKISNTIFNTLYLIVENPVTLKLFEKIEALESQSFHSLAVATWSQLLARQLGWSGEPTAFRVVLCALFHDVGLNENRDELLAKPHEQLTEQDLRILESHARRGRDILESIPGMPAEISTVAFQHHEFANGKGYPQKLLLDDIHPIARLISISNRFYEIYLQRGATRNSLKEAFAHLKKDQLHFDLRFFKTLEDIVQFKAEPIHE